LKAERGLNDQGARSLLAIYKENIAFAELKAGDKVNLVGSEPEEPEMEQAHAASATAAARLTAITPAVMRGEALQEVFNLDEGPVTLTFPATLSEDSYQDLEDRLKIVLRGLKRRSAVLQMMREDAGKGLEDDE
jgi:hypothetical protein